MIACANCGFETADDFAFCPKCGSPLVKPPPLTEERKVVTTLFCDLVGFTTLCEACDSENIDAMLRSYAACARRIIENHGGVVEKYIGDAVVAVFGFPRTHEDDAERAVRAGLRIAAEVPRLEWPGSGPLAVRVGVNTGETYLHTGLNPQSAETFLTGDAVNTAARLQSAAPPGGVVVGEHAYHLIRSAFATTALTPLLLKGKAEPVPAWLVERPVARTGLRTSGETQTPLIGRSRELKALRAALVRATEGNRMEFVLLTGEPGIGKSRLVLEFAEVLDAAPGLITWRQGRCLPYGERAGYNALAEILKAHAGILDSDDTASVADKLEAVLPEGAERAWLRQRLRPLLGLPGPAASQEENFAAWSRVLGDIAARRPAVFVVEDLHWADGPLLDFIRSLLATGLQRPLLLVATARPEFLQRDHGLVLEGETSSLLSLRPLTGHEAGLLVSALLDERLSDEVLAPVLTHVGGNPLYAEEYVRLLLDRGLLQKAHGALRLREGEDLPLPETVQAVLQARLDTLPVESRAVLCDAAVFGESFWRGGLAALAGRDPAEIDADLAVLAERQLVRPAASSSLAGEPEYLIWHALARDVAYSQMPRRVRAQKHAAAARWIEEKSAGRDELAATLAHHYVSSHDFAMAVGDDRLVESVLRPAVAALRRAAHYAANLDVPASERYLSRALELAPADDPGRLSLYAQWAMTLGDLGELASAIPALKEAAAGLRDAGECRLAAKTLTSLANAEDALGTDTYPYLVEALGLLEDDGPSEESICVLQNLAGASLNRGMTELALEYGERALAAADALSLPAERNDDVLAAVILRGAVVCQMGDARGLDSIRDAVEKALAEGSAVRMVGVHALIAFDVLGPASAIPLIERYARLYHERGLGNFESWADTVIADIRHAAGQWDEALAAFQREQAELEAAGERWGLRGTRNQLARLLTSRDETEAAAQMVDGCLEAARETHVSQQLADALLAVAVVEAGRDPEYARSCLEELSGLLDPAFAFLSVLDLPYVVRLSHALGSNELTERLTRWIPTGLPTQQCVRAYADAMLAEKRGDFLAAEADFACAATRWHEFGVPFEEAQALLGRGRCLMALGRVIEAAQPLGAAREIFGRLRARPGLRDVEECLRRIAATQA